MQKKNRLTRTKVITISIAALALMGVGVGIAGSNNVYSVSAAAPPQKPSGKGGANTQSYDYTGKLSATLKVKSAKSVTGKTYTSKTKNHNVVLAESKAKLKLNKVTLKKYGSSNDSDKSNFYGVNSILLTTGSNAKTYVKNSKLYSKATGANGIFASNKGTVYANNDTITTKGSGNSRGLDATYGGKIVANKLAISTKGAHSAAVATDRGGGYVSLTNSTLKTAGTGSPLVYSTGRIEYNKVTGTASGSQIAGMDGLNTILINNSKLTSTSNKISGSDPIKNGIIIYQSTSGDADTTTGSAARFQAVNSTLTSKITSGTMFYLTNTTANVVLQNTKLNFNSSKANLLTAVGNTSNNWGTYGANGAKVNFTGIKQTLKGNVKVDNISSVKLALLNHTTYTGKTSITSNSKAKSSAKTKSPLTVNVSKTSKWVVTGNSTVTNLNVAKGGKIVDKSGKKVTIVNASGKTLVKGSSKYKITVKGSYSTKFSTSSANKVQSSKISRTAFDKYYGTKTSF